MGQSYRIRTGLGLNKTINIQLDQQFEFLEILSLKLQQEDIYTKSCAEYGVVVGRVTANNGFGIPNARVSVFIPIDSIDESNPIISSIYPYKSPNDKNEDGYRYNLLPYEPSYSVHAATGTLPTRLDVLTGDTAVEIYDKYYKYTCKTNESGDYMIMGVPQGNHSLVMDVDLSDIGEFSLTPQDLIRMGLASEAQVAGNRFRTSTDLNSLPQIINVVKDVEVSPLWGDPQLCDIAINRVDFDLRDDANVDIQPTSVFMGSIYSTSDNFRLRKNTKPKDNMGNLCELISGPGQILAIRQTIEQDEEGNPVLEQYQLEQSGNIIDGNGVWLTELPMNLDYYITNEFGEKVISNDPTIGIPTKGKYRFKVKWQQPPTLSEQTRRPYYLLPNVKEYGWISKTQDPNNTIEPNSKLKSSYYFGLNWSGYTNGFINSVEYNKRLNEIINCEDTFYEFEFNKVYTVSGLIDEFKNGGRGRFIGIKEIDSQDCDNTINKFPVNDGFKNFDLLYFIFALLFQVIQIIGVPLLIVYHFIAFLWNNFAVLLIIYLAANWTAQAVNFWSLVAGATAGSAAFGATLGLILPFVAQALLYTAGVVFLAITFRRITSFKFGRFKLPMITYPDCQACECDPEITSPGGDQASESIPNPGLLSQLSNSILYADAITADYLASPTFNGSEEEAQLNGIMIGQSIGGNTGKPRNPQKYKSVQSDVFTIGGGGSNQFYTLGVTLPPGERVNIYNTRKKFFDNINKIKVTFSYPNNGGYNTPKYHYDNTLTVLSSQDIETGTLLTFVNPIKSTDKNYLWTGNTIVGGNQLTGINGIIKNEEFNARVYYATSQITDSYVDYTIPSNDSKCFLHLTLNITQLGSITFNDCTGTKHYSAATDLGSYTIYNDNGIDVTTLDGFATWDNITYGPACQRYIYPSDIEYYQVLTAITITTSVVNGITYYSLPNLGTGESFWSVLNASNEYQLLQNKGFWVYSQTQSVIAPTPKNYPTSFFTDFREQKILILQRGVDPYSPKLPNRYGIGKILGFSNEDDVVITGMTRLNIPIQKLPTGSSTSVQQHNDQDNIYNSSYFYTPGIPPSTTPGLQFSSYTTSNVGYYGALDSQFYTVPYKINSNYKVYGPPGTNVYLNTTVNYLPEVSEFLPGISGVTSPITNLFYGITPSYSLYDNSEDLSGAAYMFRGPLTSFFINNQEYGYRLGDNSPFNFYYSPILYPYMTGTTSQLKMLDSSKLVMRTDRLPSSDYIDNENNMNGSVSLLQQNLGFAVYPLEGNFSINTSPGFSTGAEQVTANIEGQIAKDNVVKTLNTCQNMVSLECYSGNGTNFGVSLGCNGSDNVENGCYVMMKKPLIDLQTDLNTFGEWGYRFRFFYGLCRGVLSQSFVNNWVNGSLYLFPIQVDRKFDSNNQPQYPEYPWKLIFFDKETNNFYYRSSPYYDEKFIGSPTNGLEAPTNKRNLLFPTTIINLGVKDDFYQEITFNASAKGYVMRSLQPTSYSDTSDLVNLFVISRITNNSFLSNIVSGLNGSINKLFSRPHLRIDGDLAQTMSINSEYGVIPFSPEFYNLNGSSADPVVIVGGLENPTMGVFFSSTTEDIQSKDYLTPGRINFRSSNNVNYYPYNYGIKSQSVPLYQWELNNKSNTIFGNEFNNWLTTEEYITQQKYQSLDRTSITTPTYFISSNLDSDPMKQDLNKRGYIFSIDPLTGEYKLNGISSTTFIVGAPFHFYFGLIKGETALDKFKTKYSVDE